MDFFTLWSALRQTDFLFTPAISPTYFNILHFLIISPDAIRLFEFLWFFLFSMFFLTSSNIMLANNNFFRTIFLCFSLKLQFCRNCLVLDLVVVGSPDVLAVVTGEFSSSPWSPLFVLSLSSLFCIVLFLLFSWLFSFLSSSICLYADRRAVFWLFLTPEAWLPWNGNFNSSFSDADFLFF